MPVIIMSSMRQNRRGEKWEEKRNWSYYECGPDNARFKSDFSFSSLRCVLCGGMLKKLKVATIAIIEPENIPCVVCGRKDLPLHHDYKCPECSPIGKGGKQE